MHWSYPCKNVWKENVGGTDNNSKPDLDNSNGKITILKQILIISMHIASLVKRPCYLLKLSSRNENMVVSRADNSVKIKKKICPLAIPNLISLLSIHIASLVKIPCYLLKLSSRNENMGMSRADNCVKIWRNSPISNPKPDLLNVNAYSKFDENPLLFTQVIIGKRKYGRVSGR